MRGAKHACVMVDMPFGSYQESPALAFRNAARMLAETGCAAVKLEGGAEMAETIRFLTERGIPVCGHVGLMPQAVNASRLPRPGPHGGRGGAHQWPRRAAPSPAPAHSRW